jgi:hypothetical protein
MEGLGVCVPCECFFIADARRIVHILAERFNSLEAKDSYKAIAGC